MCQKMTYSGKKANDTFLKKDFRLMAGITFVSHPSNSFCELNHLICPKTQSQIPLQATPPPPLPLLDVCIDNN